MPYRKRFALLKRVERRVKLRVELRDTVLLHRGWISQASPACQQWLKRLSNGELKRSVRCRTHAHNEISRCRFNVHALSGGISAREAHPCSMRICWVRRFSSENQTGDSRRMQLPGSLDSPGIHAQLFPRGTAAHEVAAGDVQTAALLDPHIVFD